MKRTGRGDCRGIFEECRKEEGRGNPPFIPVLLTARLNVKMGFLFFLESIRAPE